MSDSVGINLCIAASVREIAYPTVVWLLFPFRQVITSLNSIRTMKTTRKAKSK